MAHEMKNKRFNMKCTCSVLKDMIGIGKDFVWFDYNWVLKLVKTLAPRNVFNAGAEFLIKTETGQTNPLRNRS